MTKKNLLFVSSILALAFFLSACGSGSSGGGNDGYEGYKVYANILDSEDYLSHRYILDWETAFEEDDWIYIGEATETASFTGLEGLTDIMITWTEPGINFDAFDDPVGGASLGYDAEGNDIGNWAGSSNLSCDDGTFDCILGPPDGTYATTTEHPGYLMFSRTGWLYDHPDTFRVTVIP